MQLIPIFLRSVLLGSLVFSGSILASPMNSATPKAVESGGKAKLAQLEVKVKDELADKSAKGIRTLYIILYDAKSSMPMPYGALKVDLEKDAKGTVYKGMLDQGNVMIMSQGPVPESLKIKARLDKDGSAGRDAPGDFVGQADQVKVGSDVVITIDTAI